MSDIQEVTLLLKRMREVASDMLNLQFEDLGDLDSLTSLQGEQSDLRTQIENQLASERRKYSPIEKQILEDCIKLEEQLSYKFNKIFEMTNSELSAIANGKLARNVYQQEAKQYNGVFIDSKTR